jgi:hypothetical protein
MKTVPARRAITFIFGTVVLSALIYSTHIAAAPTRPAAQLPYRVAMTTVLDRDDAKLVKIHVDSGTAFNATVNHGEGHTSCASTLDPTSKLHHVEIVLLLDHIQSRQCVKELLTVGGAGGTSVLSVTSNYKLNDTFMTQVIKGTYERDQTVDLLGWQDRTFTLSIGK